jgi:peptide/nickel transport system permease protein
MFILTQEFITDRKKMERIRETKSQELIRRLKYNKSAVFGLAIVIILILCAVSADYIAPNSPTPFPPELFKALKPGFWSEDGLEDMPLGADGLGRCVLSRILYMRVVDIMFAFPALLLAIVIVTVLGQGLEKAMIAIGIVYTPQMARIIRSSVLYIKEMEYIEVQKAIGSSDARIIFRHVLPNSMAPVIVYGTLMLATAILDCAALGFLGLGAQPPTPEWGAMLSKSYSYIVSGAWWAATFPGIAILLSVVGLNLLGDGLRDILDPRLKT